MCGVKQEDEAGGGEMVWYLARGGLGTRVHPHHRRVAGKSAFRGQVKHFGDEPSVRSKYLDCSFVLGMKGLGK